MTQEVDTINVDGTDYNLSDMSNEQRYFVAQLRNIGSKIKTLEFDLDQMHASKGAFTNAITASLAEPEEDADTSE